MTINQFILSCTSRTIEPSVALENENVKQALLDKDDEKVWKILDTEF